MSLRISLQGIMSFSALLYLILRAILNSDIGLKYELLCEIVWDQLVTEF